MSENVHSSVAENVHSSAKQSGLAHSGPMQSVEINLPSCAEIELEMTKIINQRVVYHLEMILKQVAHEHLINYQQLKNQYLEPISAVAKELETKQ